MSFHMNIPQVVMKVLLGSLNPGISALMKLQPIWVVPWGATLAACDIGVFSKERREEKEENWMFQDMLSSNTRVFGD